MPETFTNWYNKSDQYNIINCSLNGYKMIDSNNIQCVE